MLFLGCEGPYWIIVFQVSSWKSKARGFWLSSSLLRRPLLSHAHYIIELSPLKIVIQYCHPSPSTTKVSTHYPPTDPRLTVYQQNLSSIHLPSKYLFVSSTINTYLLASSTVTLASIQLMQVSSLLVLNYSMPRHWLRRLARYSYRTKACHSDSTN